jgi:hypothetical protein
MLHVVKMIERSYPKSRDRIVAALFALSLSALILGVGLALVP